ncbi:hypothetical protein Cgig2_029278 [Carnegiea gigantea]|uniref:Uncharacterized protein n=1 Tax=Carnegiea gigantea TaxID=171969 RepID=A0A9Q1KW50_9CARY|nr:hypothetical protein Cgig2_029278 [Carnegiea gigantea]
MENIRNQRLSLLQEEKLLQKNKSLLLSAKLAHIGSLEQRCLLLDHQLASQNFKISSIKSQIGFLERKYQNLAQQFRVEVEDLEQMDEERESYYSGNCSEMEEFKNAAERFAVEIRKRVEELRRRRDQLKSVYKDLQNSSIEADNLEVKAAEIRKAELLAMKEKAISDLESNKQLRAELEKQLQSLR